MSSRNSSVGKEDNKKKTCQYVAHKGKPNERVCGKAANATGVLCAMHAKAANATTYLNMQPNDKEVADYLINKGKTKASAFKATPSEAPKTPKTEKISKLVGSGQNEKLFKNTIQNASNTSHATSVTHAKKIIALAKLAKLAMRCSGLTTTGHRCKHKETKNEKCNCHKNQVGRLKVTCAGHTSNGKACNCKKMMPIYKAADGSLLLDKYLCKAHRGKRLAMNVDDVRPHNKKVDVRSDFIDKTYNDNDNVHLRHKIEGIWFYLEDSKCLNCHQVVGKTPGYFCSDCAHTAVYETIKRCTGVTTKNHRCRHEKKMMSTDPDYVCKHHQKKNTQ